MDPKLIGALGLLCMCSIGSSIAASMMGGEEDPGGGGGGGAGAGAGAGAGGAGGADTPDETFTVPADIESKAECYGARYWDLRAAFGSDNAALQGHSVNSQPGGPENRDLTCNISDAEAQCYLDRYPAVQAYAGTNLKLARKHYYEVGMGEHKDFACPPAVTELKCYGERYLDLQNAFGTDYEARSTGSTLYKLGQHWGNHGKGEGRDFSCP